MGASRPRRKRTKTDPELTRQLDEARGTDRDVEAVLMLRPPNRNVVVESSAARQLAYSALDRVERNVGLSPRAINVLANLGLVVVSAQEPFVRELLTQPEFLSAAANDSGRPSANHRQQK